MRCFARRRPAGVPRRGPAQLGREARGKALEELDILRQVCSPA